MNKRDRDVEVLRSFMPLTWTSEQELKLGEVFALLDEVMWECKGSEEFKALSESRYTIERIVTAFAINRMIKENRDGK